MGRSPEANAPAVDPAASNAASATRLAQHISASLLISTEARTETHSIVDNIPAESGLEAWRRFVQRFDPAPEHTNFNLMSKLFRPPKGKVENISFPIEKWEANL